MLLSSYLDIYGYNNGYTYNRIFCLLTFTREDFTIFPHVNVRKSYKVRSVYMHRKAPFFAKTIGRIKQRGERGGREKQT